jgi:hypothetical protein
MVNLMLSLVVVAPAHCLPAKQTVTWQLSADTQSRCVQYPRTLDPNLYPAITVCRYILHNKTG